MPIQENAEEEKSKAGVGESSIEEMGSFKSEEGEIQKNQVEEILEEKDPDMFFDKASKLALTDPECFSKDFVGAFSEDVEKDHAKDSIFYFFRVFALRYLDAEREDNREEIREELMSQFREAVGFKESMDRRKGEVKESAERIFEEMDIKEKGTELSPEETEELVQYFCENVFQEKFNHVLFVCNWLQERGESHIPTSRLGKKQDYALANEIRRKVMDDPEKLKMALDATADKIKDIIQTSNDPQTLAETNDRNMDISAKFTLSEDDLLHGGYVECADYVRKEGLMCREILNPKYCSGAQNWASVSFGRQRIEPNYDLEVKDYKNPLIRIMERYDFAGQYRGNVASEYGAHDELLRHYLRTGEWRERMSNEDEVFTRNSNRDGRVAGDDAITYIIRKQRNAFEQGAGVETSHSDEYCVVIGVPSTEIRGIIIDASNENAIIRTFEQVRKFAFYVPVYDSETGVLLNERMKELYR